MPMACAAPATRDSAPQGDSGGAGEEGGGESAFETRAFVRWPVPGAAAESLEGDDDGWIVTRARGRGKCALGAPERTGSCAQIRRGSAVRRQFLGRRIAVWRRSHPGVAACGSAGTSADDLESVFEAGARGQSTGARGQRSGAGSVQRAAAGGRSADFQSAGEAAGAGDQESGARRQESGPRDCSHALTLRSAHIPALPN
jgi:hypothetical protein